jgi:DoxX-like protein
MFAVAAAVSVLLAAALAYSAVRKLGHRPEVVRTYVRVGVPEDKLNYLAIVLLAGAAGLLAGLLWAPIGIAAAIGITCYFILATGFHIRARDMRNLPTPLALAVIAAAALVLRLATL